MKRKSTDKLKICLQFAFIIAPTAYVINFVYAYSSESGGAFGDAFGAANAFFSGTALLMLVFAVILQREELEVVRDERNDTRKLLEGQEELNSLQKSALEKQIFEQTFSSILNSALSEKARLSRKPILDGKEKSSEYSNSASFASKLLKAISDDGNPPPKYYKVGASKSDVFVNLFVHLAFIVETVGPDLQTKQSLRELINSLIDEELAYCTAWYIASTCIQRDGLNRKLTMFADKYDLENHLPEEIKQGYIAARARTFG